MLPTPKPQLPGIRGETNYLCIFVGRMKTGGMHVPRPDAPGQSGGKALGAGRASYQEPNEVPNKLDSNQSFCRDRCGLVGSVAGHAAGHGFVGQVA